MDNKEEKEKQEKDNPKFEQEPDNVTREINLDDLYDGAVNNTVVIDPVTNDEVLLKAKKPNYTFIGVIIAVIILLLLYFFTNKTDLGRTTKDVAPKTTTTVNKTEEESLNGTLNCSYSSKSDAETQEVTYVANYANDFITKSTFNYVVVSNTDTSSAVVESLTNQYENFFIDNASVFGNNVTFDKNEKGFTFNVVTYYDKADFDQIIINEGQTVLYVKPSSGDTKENIQKLYTDKGFTCNISD